MTFNPLRTKKSARRVVALVLLCVLAAAAVAAYASGRADFGISPSPSSVTVAPGATATYSIQLSRVNGFDKAVALSASGLPAATRATFSPNPIPATGSGGQTNASTLRIETNVGGTTPTGTHTVSIAGSGGGLTRRTSVTLQVQAAGQANYALTVSPSARHVAQSDQATYTVQVERSGGFAGAVALSTQNLPDRTSATFSPNPIPAGQTTSTLTVATAHNAPEGVYGFTVAGQATLAGAATTRLAALTLGIEKTKPFGVTGDLPAQVAPGTSAPLDLTLSNPHRFAIRVSNVSVALEEATSAPACRAGDHFRIHQIPAERYAAGIWLAARQSASLSQLGVTDAHKPRVEMLNLPTNQDACKSAQLHLQYGGTATK